MTITQRKLLRHYIEMSKRAEQNKAERKTWLREKLERVCMYAKGPNTAIATGKCEPVMFSRWSKIPHGQLKG